MIITAVLSMCREGTGPNGGNQEDKAHEERVLEDRLGEAGNQQDKEGEDR
jgi:hypothetical protein